METHRKRTYVAPALAAKGGIVERTRMIGTNGTGDPDNPVLWKKVPAGSAGFAL